jgi:hypothetical protein
MPDINTTIGGEEDRSTLHSVGRLQVREISEIQTTDCQSGVREAQGTRANGGIGASNPSRGMKLACLFRVSVHVVHW